MAEKKEVTKQENNVLALLGFIFSLTFCLAFPGLVLSIVGLVNDKNYKNSRKNLAIAGIAVSGFFLLVSMFIMLYDFDTDQSTTNNNNVTYTSSSTEKNNVDKVKNTIEVIDFSNMTKADIDSWCSENKFNCIYLTEYSDSVTKGSFVKQSVEVGQRVYENDTIKISYSLGKEPTVSQKNALSRALSYLKYSSFSYSGLVEQLEFEKYSHEDAVYAVDNCGADWNEQAVKKAESYLKYSSFSRDGLIDQLEFEGFTYEQAVYGVSQNGL